MTRYNKITPVWGSFGVISARFGEILMKWGRLGEIWRKVLAFRHLEIKQQKKIEEIRRILPNLGEFDQIPQIYHEKGNFLRKHSGPGVA